MTSQILDSYRPQTLQEWRDCKNLPQDAFPRKMWTPPEPFFLSHGYTLWGPPHEVYLRPPNDAPHTPDGFFHNTKYNDS
jgi:hypothetical protein